MIERISKKLLVLSMFFTSLYHFSKTLGQVLSIILLPISYYLENRCKKSTIWPERQQGEQMIIIEVAKPILAAYFANEIGTRETKEKLNLSPKTHLSESSVYKRYKRELPCNILWLRWFPLLRGWKIILWFLILCCS